MSIDAIIKYTMAAAAVSSTILPHTHLLEKYRKFRARYGFDGTEIPVRKDIKEKFQEVVEDINLSEENRQNIKLFNVYGIDIFHAGTTFTKHGAVIGVPINFEYKDADTITQDTISFQNNKQIDWSTPAGKEFKKSLVLSDNAQKFAMAVEALTVMQPDPLYKVLCITIDVLLAVGVYDMLCLVLKITKRQRLLRIFSLGISAIGGYICWLFSKVAIDMNRESSVNEKLTMLGPEYIEGGIEYYEKLSSRNKALRVLLGEKGTYLFTSSGNETSWSRQRGIPISDQINYFKSQLHDGQLV